MGRMETLVGMVPYQEDPGNIQNVGESVVKLNRHVQFSFFNLFDLIQLRSFQLGLIGFELGLHRIDLKKVT